MKFTLVLYSPVEHSHEPLLMALNSLNLDCRNQVSFQDRKSSVSLRVHPVTYHFRLRHFRLPIVLSFDGRSFPAMAKIDKILYKMVAFRLGHCPDSLSVNLYPSHFPRTSLVNLCRLPSVESPGYKCRATLTEGALH